MAALALLLCTLGAGLAGAAPTADNPDLGKAFATVWRLRGTVELIAPGAPARALQEGQTVRVGDLVRAQPNSEAVLKTADLGLIGVRPGAEFMAERFAADAKPNDRQSLNLATGSLRVISGWIGKLNRQEHRVTTPTATIGIRGTDHEPYVLPAAMASLAYPPGTYDKVNRGATLLDANGGSVAIEPGRVGFARDPKSLERRTRALITLLLPVLLDKVPEFYVGGAFEQEMDAYADSVEALIAQRLGPLAASQAAAPTAAATSPPPGNTPARPGAPSATAALAATSSLAGCQPERIGAAWLERFDQALLRRDADAILALFAPEIVARATVRNGEKMQTLEFNRAEMVQSTLRSLAGLKDYQQRRVSLQATLAAGDTPARCQRLEVQSIAIEQGLMNGKPYRFEALEQYRLELRDGHWLATTAHTTQR